MDDNNEYTEDIKNDISKETKKSIFHNTKLIIVMVVAVLLLAVGFCVFMTPQNRISRQLSLGEKYLLNEQYDEAIVALAKAIEIDETCFDAYLMSLKAYDALGKEKELQEIYSKAIVVIQSVDDSILSENMDSIVDIYGSSELVYKDDLQAIIDTLEEGFKKTENEELKNKLMDCYFEQAVLLTKDKKFEEALKNFDRLIDLGKNIEEIDSEMSKCIESYVNELLISNNFSKAKEILQKYKKYKLSIDFDDLLNKIDELEKFYLEAQELLKSIFDFMADKNYKDLTKLFMASETKDFVERLENDRYIYIENNANSGKGAGIYKLNDGTFYFYYGDFVELQREGAGLSYLRYNTEIYTTFEGKWKNDKPNGKGKRETYGYDFYSYIDGNLVDGHFDGHLKAEVTIDIYNFDMSFDANEGKPKDRTEDYNRMVKPWDQEGRFPFAIGSCDGNTYTWSASKAENVGAIGFEGLDE